MANTLLESVLNATNTTYLTHNIHPYPAKFIPQIPDFMIDEFSNEGDLIMDPFCGSGTTLVESRIHKRKSIGIDINPIASLVSKVKTTPISKNAFGIVDDMMDKIYEKYNKSKYSNMELHEFYNRDHWFEKIVRNEIALILGEMKNIKNKKINEFCKVMLSSIGVIISNQDSDTRYAAIKKKNYKKKTLKLFSTKTEKSKNKILDFSKYVDSSLNSHVYNADARNLHMLKKNDVDLIITSPPYPNVYDYYLYHKQRMNLLKLDPETAKNNEIGSRLRYSSLKWGIDTFHNDMAECFNEMHRVLKPNHHTIVVIGDSVIAGKLINGKDIIVKVGKSKGFNLIDCIEYDLDDISRVFGRGFRTKGKKEYIITLKNGI